MPPLEADRLRLVAAPMPSAAGTAVLSPPLPLRLPAPLAPARPGGLPWSRPAAGAPQTRAAGPHAPVAAPAALRRDPGWLNLLSAVHRSERAPLPAFVDWALLVAVCYGLGLVPLYVAALWAAALVAANALARVYDDRDSVTTQGVLWYPGRVLLPVTAVALAAVASGALPLHRGLALAGAAFGALLALRGLAWPLIAGMRRRGMGLRRTLIVGGGAPANMVWRKLSEFPTAGLVPIGVLPFDRLASPGRFAEEIRASRAGHVIVVPVAADEVYRTAGLRRSVGLDATFSLVPPLAELFLHPAKVTAVGGLPLIRLGRVMRGRTTFPGKRAMDLVLASVLLVVLAPVFAATALAIRLDDGQPVFYRQTRVGRSGRSFPMLKFRSMVVGADRMLPELLARNESDGLLFKMSADPRVTRVGRWLRRISIDELPQLVNVLRGEMSLVGPRPLPVRLEAFADVENDRHSAMPGITGFWQVSGGTGLSYAEMIKLDLAYLHNWSLWLDVKLLLRTLPALFYRHGPA